MNDLTKLDVAYFKSVDLLESYELKLIMDEIFLEYTIELISVSELQFCLSKIKALCLSDIDKTLFELIFKHYGQRHYFHPEYGFIIMLNISSISRPVKPADLSGYIYVCLSDIGLYKIGASRSPEQRVKSLGLGSSIRHEFLFKIKTDEMFKFEKLIHNKYVDKHIHSEWFKLSEYDLEEIRNLTLADMV